MTVGDRQEPADLGFGPRRLFSLQTRLHDLFRKRHPGSRVSSQHSVVDGVGQRCAQHRAENLNAPPSQESPGEKPVEPRRHIGSFEMLQRHAADSVSDVFGRPLVWRS